ncbi:MAG: glycosyl transferase [Dehalococcoidia bacterium]|nr:MAG: glycosyl transferase [Dehalococcoidia bacterium]
MSGRGCLVVRLGAIGDTVLAIPALRRLRERYGRVVVVGSAPAVLLGPVVDRVVDVEAPAVAALFRSDPAADDHLCAELGSFEAAVVWLKQPHAVVTALARLGIPRVLAAPSLPAGRRHVVDHLLATIGEPPGARVELPVAPQSRSRAVALLRRLGVPSASVLLAIGAGGAAKRWPAERFAALAARLACPVAVLAGPADEASVAAFRQAQPDIPIVAGVELELLPAILADAALVVANDSGPGHLAAAVGTPVVSLFGPTDPEVWAPRGPRVTVLQAEDGRLESLDVADVCSAVERLLA